MTCCTGPLAKGQLPCRHVLLKAFNKGFPRVLLNSVFIGYVQVCCTCKPSKCNGPPGGFLRASPPVLADSNSQGLTTHCYNSALQALQILLLLRRSRSQNFRLDEWLHRQPSWSDHAHANSHALESLVDKGLQLLSTLIARTQ